MIKSHGLACGEAAGGCGGGRAGGSGSGGSDRIGDNLAKIEFLLKNIVLGHFLLNFDNFRTF